MVAEAVGIQAWEVSDSRWVADLHLLSPKRLVVITLRHGLSLISSILTLNYNTLSYLFYRKLNQLITPST